MTSKKTITMTKLIVPERIIQKYKGSSFHEVTFHNKNYQSSQMTLKWLSDVKVVWKWSLIDGLLSFQIISLRKLRAWRRKRRSLFLNILDTVLVKILIFILQFISKFDHSKLVLVYYLDIMHGLPGPTERHVILDLLEFLTKEVVMGKFFSICKVESKLLQSISYLTELKTSLPRKTLYMSHISTN